MRRRQSPSLIVWASTLALTLVISCGKTKPPLSGPATGTGGSGSTPDAGAGTGGAGGTDAGRVACLDQPGDLPRPPANGLPCDLIPPGVALPP